MKNILKTCVLCIFVLFLIHLPGNIYANNFVINSYAEYADYADSLYNSELFDLQLANAVKGIKLEIEKDEPKLSEVEEEKLKQLFGAFLRKNLDGKTLLLKYKSQILKGMGMTEREFVLAINTPSKIANTSLKLEKVFSKIYVTHMATPELLYQMEKFYYEFSKYREANARQLKFSGGDSADILKFLGAAIGFVIFLLLLNVLYKRKARKTLPVDDSDQFVYKKASLLLRLPIMFVIFIFSICLTGATRNTLKLLEVDIIGRSDAVILSYCLFYGIVMATVGLFPILLFFKVAKWKRKKKILPLKEMQWRKFLVKIIKNLRDWQKIFLGLAFVSIIMLIMAVSDRQDAGFYIFLRIVVTVSFVGLLFEKLPAWCKLLFILSLILYNPLLPIHLGERDHWSFFNFVALSLLIVPWLFLLYRSAKRPIQ